MHIKNTFLKKVILLTIIFLLIEIIFLLLLPSLKYNYWKLTRVSCVEISPKSENQKYCSNIEEDLYNKILNDNNSKYKVETITDEKGNILNKVYKDIDEQGVEKGSLSYTFDNRQQLLSEIAKGSFGNYRNESYYDIFHGNRIVLVKYKNDKEIPYSILTFQYNIDKTKEIELRSLYE